MMLKLFLNLAIYLSLISVVLSRPSKTEDIFTPEQCNTIVKTDDHLLVEFEVIFSNGTIAPGYSTKRPNQLFHFIADQYDEISSLLIGSCEKSTKKFTWNEPRFVDFSPLPIQGNIFQLEDEISLTISIEHITSALDYQIFSAFSSQNLSQVLDYIDEHIGINALDEYGHTPLMLAASNNYLQVVAALLNTRRPAVDINLAKSSGFTALIYAIEKSLDTNPSIVSALLRRGANPNLPVQQESSKGNTPLHYACMLEKTKIVELLLQYGADPLVRNQYGLIPFQLIPAETVRSTKLYLKKLFEEAVTKQRAASASSSTSSSQKTEL